MKDFLIRLAQRSIGQVPVVRSRAALPPSLPAGEGAGPPVEAPSAPARAPSSMTGEPPWPAPHAALTARDPLPATTVSPAATPAEPLPRPESSAIPTIRIVSETVAPPLPLPPAAFSEPEGRSVEPAASATAEPAMATPAIQAAPTIIIQPAPPAPKIAPPALAIQAVVQAPTAAADDPGAVIDGRPTLRSAPVEFIMPKHESRDTVAAIEPAASPRPADRDLPQLSGREAMPPVQAPQSDERVVQVRIGAIEIHAPPPPAPAAPPAPLQRPVSRGGFDEFARLRSYAPWEW